MGGAAYIDALVPSGTHRTRKTIPVTDVSGRPIAHCSQVPPLLAHRVIRDLRRSEAPGAQRRERALREAGRRFAEDSLAGLSPAEYEHLVSRVCGLPISAVRSSTAAIAAAAREAAGLVRDAVPAGAVTDAADIPARSAGAVWVRRGQVLAINAPGNHPAVHATWLEALALGYRVAVRPSSREPFTPQRLVAALRASGLRDDEVVFLPGDRATADELLREADLGIVYGGDEMVGRYAHDPTVLVQGPGRSKVLVGGDATGAAELIAESVASEGGTACANATAVLVEGDPEPLAVEVAKRLAALPALPPQEEAARLPVLPLAAARAVESAYHARVGDGRVLLGRGGIIQELGDDSAALGPAVILLESPDDQRLRAELPFPCVWFAPWRPESGVEPLKDSLVVTALGCSDSVVEQLVGDPSIAGIHVGDRPTNQRSLGAPHDGYLPHFLMRGKGVIRS